MLQQPVMTMRDVVILTLLCKGYFMSTYVGHFPSLIYETLVNKEYVLNVKMLR